MQRPIHVCVALFALAGATEPAWAYKLPGPQSVVSCQDVCVAKAAAPRPGHPNTGHLVRQCYNRLTGQYVGDRPIPFTPCSR
jgi:hypothetical protein